MIAINPIPFLACYQGEYWLGCYCMYVRTTPRILKHESTANKDLSQPYLENWGAANQPSCRK